MPPSRLREKALCSLHRDDLDASMLFPTQRRGNGDSHFAQFLCGHADMPCPSLVAAGYHQFRPWLVRLEVQACRVRPARFPSCCRAWLSARQKSFFPPCASQTEAGRTRHTGIMPRERGRDGFDFSFISNRDDSHALNRRKVFAQQAVSLRSGLHC